VDGLADLAPRVGDHPPLALRPALTESGKMTLFLVGQRVLAR
jgi:hypothetical protein